MIPLGDEYKPLKKPYVNYALIVINTVVFFYFFLQGFYVFRKAVYLLGLVPYYIIQGKRLWTIFTSMFMHGSVDHLLGNMLYLYIFGDNVEDALGHAKYLLFYIISGIGATIMHIVTLPPYLHYWLIPAVGASGAISGVLGAYMLLFPRVRIKVLLFTIYGIIFIRVPAYYFIGIWFLYQFYAATYALLGIRSGIAFWAHIGGFITGLLLVKLFGWEKKKYIRAYPVRPGVYRIPVE